MTGLIVIPTLGWRAMFLIGGIGTLWVWWERRMRLARNHRAG